jgi:hypothetical protein
MRAGTSDLTGQTPKQQCKAWRDSKWGHGLCLRAGEHKILPDGWKSMNENPKTVPDQKATNYMDLEETGYDYGNCSE